MNTIGESSRQIDRLRVVVVDEEKRGVSSVPTTKRQSRRIPRS